MKKETLNEWFKLYRQVVNGYHLSKEDKRKLLRLNFEVLEASQRIHNDNMLDKEGL